MYMGLIWVKKLYLGNTTGQTHVNRLYKLLILCSSVSLFCCFFLRSFLMGDSSKTQFVACLPTKVSP